MFRGYNAQLRKLEVCHTVYMYVAQTLLHGNEVAWASLGRIAKNDLFRLNQSQKKRFNKDMMCNIQSNNQKSKDSINGKSTRSKKDAKPLCRRSSLFNETLHCWLRSIKGGQFRLVNFASHFIRVQIFQIYFSLILYL